MTRKETVEYCSLSRNRKMDEGKGLVCGLTNEYADFEGQYAGQMFVLLSSVTGTLAAVFSVFWVLRVMKINRKDDKLSIDRITDCIRKEGYYPVVDGNMVGFKIQGHSFFVAYDPIRLQIGYIRTLSNGIHVL